MTETPATEAQTTGTPAAVAPKLPREPVSALSRINDQSPTTVWLTLVVGHYKGPSRRPIATEIVHEFVQKFLLLLDPT